MLSSWLAGLPLSCSAGTVMATAKAGGLELFLILNGEDALIGRPYPIEVVIKNTGPTEVVLLDQLEFFATSTSKFSICFRFLPCL